MVDTGIHAGSQRRELRGEGIQSERGIGDAPANVRVLVIGSPRLERGAATAAADLLRDLRTALAGHIVVMVTHHASDVLASDARVRLGIAMLVDLS